MALGAFFGIFPDFDLLFSPFFRGAHRSAASHSLLASTAVSVAWAALLVFLVPYLGLSDGIDTRTVTTTTAVVFLSTFVHAVEDSLSVGGCRLLYPLSRRRVRGPVRYDDIAANSSIMIIATITIVAAVGCA